MLAWGVKAYVSAPSHFFLGKDVDCRGPQKSFPNHVRSSGNTSRAASDQMM